MYRLFLPPLTTGTGHTAPRERKHIPIRRSLALLVPLDQPALTPRRSVIRYIGTQLRRSADEAIDVDLSPEGIGLDEAVEGVGCGFQKEEVARWEEGEDRGDEFVGQQVQWRAAEPSDKVIVA